MDLLPGEVVSARCDHQCQLLADELFDWKGAGFALDGFEHHGDNFEGLIRVTSCKAKLALRLIKRPMKAPITQNSAFKIAEMSLKRLCKITG
jgi:hypothetical protein